VLLDVVLNHTGEGDHLGPTLSLRGLDNASYYRLRPDDPSRCVDDTGCGNTLALDRPPVLRLAMAALRGWVRRAGIDGFRFDLATTLARRAGWPGPGDSGRLGSGHHGSGPHGSDPVGSHPLGSSQGGGDLGGFDPHAPLLAAIAQDPLLRDRALIAEPWDVGPGGYRLGEFPAGWGEWNDRYRDTVRRFWRGDGGMLGALATRFAGSADVFAPRHRPLTRGVNFVTSHDGFTLADLVAYTAKRNAANGEANRDGTDASMSWNNGVEGPGDDPVLRAARARDVRALLATLLLSRGTPMLTMGDECGRSQGGNNNAYAQDNALSWLDWTTADGALMAFVARLVRARNECAALTGALPLTGLDVDASLIPDVAWRRPDGRVLAPEDWQHPDHRTLVAALYAPDSRALVVLHAGQSPIEVTLPALRAGPRSCYWSRPPAVRADATTRPTMRCTGWRGRPGSPRPGGTSPGRSTASARTPRAPCLRPCGCRRQPPATSPIAWHGSPRCTPARCRSRWWCAPARRSRWCLDRSVRPHMVAG
jgi:glycogen operon protein